MFCEIGGWNLLVTCTTSYNMCGCIGGEGMIALLEPAAIRRFRRWPAELAKIAQPQLYASIFKDCLIQ